MEKRKTKKAVESNRDSTRDLLKSNLDSFLKSIYSLQASSKFTAALIKVQEKTNSNQIKHFLKSIESDLARRKIKPEYAVRYKELKREFDINRMAFKVVPRSTIISMVSQFDAFMGSLIRIVLLSKPEILNGSGKQLTYSTLSGLKTINEAKNYLVESEVDSVLRESHTYHFEWLESKIDTTLRKDLPSWKVFIELTERRNLFTHCGGIVSNQYLSICRKNGLSIDESHKVGCELEASQEYLAKAYLCLYELGVKLTQVIWRKLIPKDLEEADAHLNEICYDLICEEEYDLSDILLEFATNTLKKHYNENITRIFLVNKALSKRLNGNREAASNIIEKIDWSASSNDFKLAKELLVGDLKKVIELMQKIGRKGEIIDKSSYRTWPLFKELRTNREFKKVFRKIYKEDYELKEDRLEYTFELTAKPSRNKNENKENFHPKEKVRSKKP